MLDGTWNTSPLQFRARTRHLRRTRWENEQHMNIAFCHPCSHSTAHHPLSRYFSYAISLEYVNKCMFMHKCQLCQCKGNQDGINDPLCAPLWFCFHLMHWVGLSVSCRVAEVWKRTWWISQAELPSSLCSEGHVLNHSLAHNHVRVNKHLYLNTKCSSAGGLD